MIVSHTISILPVRAQRFVMKSLVASINQSIIGYARAHIKRLKYADRGEQLPSVKLAAELAAKNGTNTFDNFNTEEIGKDLASESDRFMIDAGNEIVETPLQQCRKFSVLRSWLAKMIEDTPDYNAKFDAPYGVANSLAFNISREPADNTAAMRKMAEATGIPLERLLAAGVKQFDDGATELKDNASRILGLYDDCCKYEENLYELDASLFSLDQETQADTANINFEILFSSLPVQTQYKLGIKINEALIKSSDDCVTLMLDPKRRGSKEAAGDVRIIDAAREEHYNWLRAFDKKHGSELDAYAERGYMPALPDSFDAPITQAMNAQSDKEAQAKAAAAIKTAAAQAEAEAQAEADAALALAARAKPSRVKKPTAMALSLSDAAIDRFNKRGITSL